MHGNYRLDPPEVGDHADTVQYVVHRYEYEIDDALDVLANIDDNARELGVTEFGDAMRNIVEVIRFIYPKFEKTDRLRKYRQRSKRN